MTATAATWAPPTPKNVLDTDERAQLVAQLRDPDYRPPQDIDDDWFKCMRTNSTELWSGARWTAKMAVRILARACNDMGLRSEEIAYSIRDQEDVMLRASGKIAMPRHAFRALELTEFLTAREDGPWQIVRKLNRTWDADKRAAAFCAVRTLAVLILHEPMTWVDLHECIRRVRDRTEGGEGEKGSIWIPEQLRPESG
jgi:hypothetical protein